MTDMYRTVKKSKNFRVFLVIVFFLASGLGGALIYSLANPQESRATPSLLTVLNLNVTSNAKIGGNLNMTGNNITEIHTLNVSGSTIHVGNIRISEVEGLFTLNKAILFETGFETPDYLEGLLYYCYEDKTLTIYNDEEDISLQIGQEQWVRVKNVENQIIYDGQAVYISGATSVARGGYPKVKLAIANDPSTAKVLGLATHNIEPQGFGYVTTFGIVRGINTSMFSNKDLLYISNAEFGILTNIPPEPPNFILQIGTVITSHETEGKIFVTIPPTDVLGPMVIDTLTINNNLTVMGKTTMTGGVDPPYISFSEQNHNSIREFTESTLSHEKTMLFWNGETNQFEIYDIAKDEFHGLYEELITKITELEARIEALEQKPEEDN